MGKTNYLRVSSIKKLVKENGRRSGKDFIKELDIVVSELVIRACKTKSKKKTLNSSVLKETICLGDCENDEVEN